MLSSRIKAVEAAIDTEVPIWFPGLAPILAADVIVAPGCRWTSEGYGTGRWLAQDATAPRQVEAKVEMAGTDMVVERLPQDLQRRFASLPFADGDLATAAQLLSEAVTLLARPPGVGALVGSLVKAVHILRAEAGFDINHSDPELPFSIFVSIPRVDECACIARLAETLLHEALHLQLTLIEATVPLVAVGGGEGYSPWQRRPRPLSGLLHGLYVFSGISEVFSQLAAADPCLSAYATRRRREIASEVATLGPPPVGLTPAGASVWARAMAAAAE
jgi:HEXXH motif-containing protein